MPMSSPASFREQFWQEMLTANVPVGDLVALKAAKFALEKAALIAEYEIRKLGESL